MRSGSATRRRRAIPSSGRMIGPGFRPEQHRWRSEFPLPGSGALNRLCVHPAIVDFMERALETRDLRCYQAQVSAKYTGERTTSSRCTPIATTRGCRRAWSRRGGTSSRSSTSAMSTPATRRRTSFRCGDRAAARRRSPLFMPRQDPELYAAEIAARGRARLVARVPARCVSPRRRPHRAAAARVSC